jgi:hypothetical protein
MAEMDQDPGYGGTVGERLRRAREARGLTLEDVATQTRVPIRHLRSIEDSVWDDLPAVTYSVGFGRSYANAVGLDGAEIGRELREQLGDGTRGPQVSPTVYAPPDPSRVPSRSLAWVAGLLLVVLVAAYLIWRSQLGDGGDESAQPAAAASDQQVQEAQAQPQAQPAAPNLAGQPVTLVASDEVWLRIDDRAQAGQALRQGVLKAGEEYQVPASAQQPVIRTRRPQVLRVRVGDRDLGQLAPQERLISNVSLLAADLAGSLQPGQPGAGGAPGAAPAQR